MGAGALAGSIFGSGSARCTSFARCSGSALRLPLGSPARWVKAIRRDRWIIFAWIVATNVAVFAVGLAKYGSVIDALWLPIKMFVIPFLLFNFVIGSFVHVHHIAPNIRWWSGR